MRVPFVYRSNPVGNGATPAIGSMPSANVRLPWSALLALPLLGVLSGVSPADEPVQPFTATELPAQSEIVRKQPGEFVLVQKPVRKSRNLGVISIPTESPPKIDGEVDDTVWQLAPLTTTLDGATQREIRLQSVHTGKDIYFLVRFADTAPSESHKTWGWDQEEGIYKRLPDREDSFVFKWSRSGNDVDLSFRNAEPHQADIWFWKARRTNPPGYADDKWQSLTIEKPDSRSLAVRSPRHGTLYLKRMGDKGKGSYAERLVFDYEGDLIHRYIQRPPKGSRGDVRAKGVWRDGFWSIEFARRLQTGNSDDQPFETGKTYLFGVSRHEMSAAPSPTLEWTQPLYKSGDPYDRLLLEIKE